MTPADRSRVTQCANVIACGAGVIREWPVEKIGRCVACDFPTIAIVSDEEIDRWFTNNGKPARESFK